MDSQRPYVGIDVAKAQLDVAVRPTGQQWRAPNQDEAIALLVSRLQELAPALVVLEASGGLEVPVVAALAGVAPFNRDSGTLRGKRTVWGGRAPLRAALYMAAVVASTKGGTGK